MKRFNDIYTAGNDYLQDKSYVEENTYYDGIYHIVNNVKKLNKRVTNKPQSDWEENPNGFIFSKDYAVIDDGKTTKNDETEHEVFTVALTDENGNETELVMNFVNIPSQDVESIETQLTKINGDDVNG